MDLALNNLQRLICHKTKPNQTKPIGVVAFKKDTFGSPTFYVFLYFIHFDILFIFIFYLYLYYIIFNISLIRLFLLSVRVFQFADCTVAKGKVPPPPNKCLGYNAKRLNGGMRSTLPLSLLPATL